MIKNKQQAKKQAYMMAGDCVERELLRLMKERDAVQISSQEKDSFNRLITALTEVMSSLRYRGIHMKGEIISPEPLREGASA